MLEGTPGPRLCLPQPRTRSHGIPVPNPGLACTPPLHFVYLPEPAASTHHLLTHAPTPGSMLSDMGELDNTYFIFMSDNGYHLGNHQLKW